MAVTPGYCSQNEDGTWTWVVLDNGVPVSGISDTKEEAEKDRAEKIEELKRRHKIVIPSYKRRPPFEPDRER